MRTGHFLWIPLAVAALAGGCKDDPVRVAGDVQGTWAFVDSAGSSFFLRITENQIVAWNEDPIADCFERVEYEVVEIDGVDFRLGSAADTFEVELFRDEEELVLAAGESEVRYQETTTDPEALPVCAPPAPSAVCSELPELVIDEEVRDSLEVSDPENPDGSHFDLYRIEVAAADSFRIDMSASFDSYLILYDSLAVLLDQNDDRSSLTFDARIARALAPGCHMVMATSAVPNAFGDYELSVTLP